MSAVIGALRGVLSLDSAAFEKGAKRAEASMSRLQRSLHRSGESMKRLGRQMSLRMTAPMAAMATVAVKSSLQVVDAQAKMAQSLETSVVSLQNLERAASLAGVSSGQLEGSLRRMTRRISLAEQGTGPAVKALERLGLSAENLNDIPADERVAKINTAIRDLIPAAEQAGVASQVFGDLTGLAMLRLDGDVIARAASEIEAFGVAVSDIDAAQIEAANDAMSALGLVSRGLANQLTVALAPTLQSIAEKAAELGKWFNDLSPSTRRMVAAGTALTAALGPAVFTMGLMATGLAALASPIGLVVLGLGAMAGAAVLVASNWDTLTTRMPTLEHVADRVRTSLEALQQVLDGDLLGGLKTFVVDLEGLQNPLVTAFENWAGLIADLVYPEWRKSLRDIVEATKDLPATLKKHAEEAIRAFVDGLLDQWREFRGQIRSLFGLSDVIAESIEGARQAGRDVAAGFVTGVESGESEVRRAGRNMARGVQYEVREELETQSPSKVFMRIGRDLMEGLAIGVRDNAQPAIDAARFAAEEMTLQASSAVQSLSGAFGDFLAGGLRDFDGFIDRILNDWRGMISQMIATAVANPIRLSLGATAAGGTAAATLSTSGTSGLLGGVGLLGGLGTFGSAVSAGLQGTLASGLGSVLPTIGASISGIGAGGSIAAGLGTALGAALPVIGAVGLALGAFRTKVEEVGEGVVFALDGLDGMVETFNVVKKSNAFGLNKWKEWDYDPASDELASAILGPINDAQTRIVEMAESIGIVSDVFRGFSNSVRVELKGLSDEAATAALQEAGQGVIDAFAQMAVAGSGMRQEGETASQILERLANSLAIVNPMLEGIGKATFGASPSGAGAASDLLQSFGGAQNMAAAFEDFVAVAYTEAEQLDRLAADMKRQLDALNVTMPETRAEFRALVEGMNLTTDAGRQGYATLLSLSGGFDAVFTSAENAAQALLDQAAAQEAQARAAREATRRAEDLANAEKAREAEAAIRTAAQSANARLSAAETALRGAVRARQGNLSERADLDISAVQEAAAAAAAGLRSEASSLSGRASTLRSFRDALSDAIGARRGSDLVNPGGQYRAASELLQRTAGRGWVGDTGALREAIGVVANLNAKSFGSLAEMQHAFNKNTAALDQIRKTAGEELGEAAAQVAALERNAAAIETTAALQVSAIEAARDAQIASLQALLDRTLGVENAVLSVKAALHGYTQALAGVNAIPAFASGGTHLGGFRLVGERGPELEATGPSRIYSAGQTRDLLSGDGSAREVKALRGEVAELLKRTKDHARDAERTRLILSKWDTEGQPAVKQQAPS